jgi:hypothetical protein
MFFLQFERLVFTLAQNKRRNYSFVQFFFNLHCGEWNQGPLDTAVT